MTIKDDTTTADKRRLDMKYAWYPLGLNYDMVSSMYLLCSNNYKDNYYYKKQIDSHFK